MSGREGLAVVQVEGPVLDARIPVFDAMPKNGFE